MSVRKFRTVYGPHRDVSIGVFEKSKTHQSFLDDVDINKIIDRFNRTGQLDASDRRPLDPGDYSDVGTYMDAMNIVNEARDQFASLSSKVRARFDNDPVKFLAFVTDPSNALEMVELGLATKVEVPAAPESVALNVP